MEITEEDRQAAINAFFCWQYMSFFQHYAAPDFKDNLEREKAFVVACFNETGVLDGDEIYDICVKMENWKANILIGEVPIEIRSKFPVLEWADD